VADGTVREALLMTHSGGLLFAPSDGCELVQLGFHDKTLGFAPAVLRLPQPLPALPFRLHLAVPRRDYAMPGNELLSRAEIMQGALPGSVAIRYQARYLSAQPDGMLSLSATSLAESESFLLLPAHLREALEALRSTAWQVEGTERLILPGQIHADTGFTFRLGRLQVDLATLDLPGPTMPGRLQVRLPDGDAAVLVPAPEGWRAMLAEACLKGLEEGTRRFQDVAAIFMQIGFESWQIEFRQAKAILYLPDGGVTEGALGAMPGPMGAGFDQAQAIAAVRGLREAPDQVTFRAFCESLWAAGCAGFLMAFAAGRVLYIGRFGETLVEEFAWS
jgi:hypothetical protein